MTCLRIRKFLTAAPQGSQQPQYRPMVTPLALALRVPSPCSYHKSANATWYCDPVRAYYLDGGGGGSPDPGRRNSQRADVIPPIRLDILLEAGQVSVQSVSDRPGFARWALVLHRALIRAPMLRMACHLISSVFSPFNCILVPPACPDIRLPSRFPLPSPRLLILLCSWLVSARMTVPG